MYYPYTWTAITTPSVNRNPKRFQFMDMPTPEDHCEGVLDQKGVKGECRFKIHNGISEWYTNNTRISGEPTISDDMFDGNKPKGVQNPWASPGSASVVGEGCGVNGGNPDGCGKGKNLSIPNESICNCKIIGSR